MRFLHWLRCLFFWRTSHTLDGGQTHYYRYHLVLPWFCGLRIPVFTAQFLRDIQSGFLPFMDTKTGDSLLWRMKCKPNQGRWLSILSEGSFEFLKEERRFWKEFEEA